MTQRVQRVLHAFSSSSFSRSSMAFLLTSARCFFKFLKSSANENIFDLFHFLVSTSVLPILVILSLQHNSINARKSSALLLLLEFPLIIASPFNNDETFPRSCPNLIPSDGVFDCLSVNVPTTKIG